MNFFGNSYFSRFREGNQRFWQWPASVRYEVTALPPHSAFEIARRGSDVRELIDPRSFSEFGRAEPPFGNEMNLPHCQSGLCAGEKSVWTTSGL